MRIDEPLVPATCTCHQWGWPNKQGVRFCKRCGMIEPPDKDREFWPSKASVKAPEIDARAKFGDA